MSLRINHNTNAIAAHRNLLVNDKAMSSTLEKLSSGLKINKAADGPATLVVSEQMRAQIAGMNQAIDNSETAISMVQTTEANLSEVSSLLTSVRQLAIHASNEGANDDIMLQADQQEINNALATIDRISEQAQFGQRKLLDGTNGASGSTTGDGIEFVQASLKTQDSRTDGFEVTVARNASQAAAIGTATLTEEMVKAGETLTIIENGKTASYTTTANDSVETSIKNLHSEISRNGLNVELETGSGGNIEIRHKEFGSAHSFQVSSTSAGILSKEAGAIELAQAGQDVKGTINGESTTGKGNILTGSQGSQTVDGLSVRVIGKWNDISDDAPTKAGQVYITQNSLNYQVGGNRGQTVGVAINSTHSKTIGRNVENDSGFKSLSDIDVTTFEGAQDTLALVDKAINDITSARGELGAFQKNTLESNLANLRVAQENLVSSESILRDVDMASEMASFTRNQIMTQSATAMLAHANQAPATVLSLLK